MRLPLRLISPVAVREIAFPILDKKLLAFKFPALILPLVASSVIEPISSVIGVNNSCVPIAVPQRAMSPFLYKVPLSHSKSSVTSKVQMPEGFSPLKTANPPSPSGLNLPLKGATPSAILPGARSSSKVSWKSSPEPPTLLNNSKIDPCGEVR